MSLITDLSKSRYCKGIQCPKILWLGRCKPEEAENVLSETVMENGNLVGDLARSYFGEYSLVEFSFDKSEMTSHTPWEIAEIRANLLRYCGLDTYAMVKVLRKLKEAVR